MKASIDLGLAIASLHAVRGEPMSCAELAEFCECSEEQIRNIEKAALEKVKRLIKKAAPELSEAA